MLGCNCKCGFPFPLFCDARCHSESRVKRKGMVNGGKIGANKKKVTIPRGLTNDARSKTL